MPELRQSVRRAPRIAVVTQPKASSGLGQYLATALEDAGAEVDIVDCLASKPFKLWPVMKSIRFSADAMWKARWENLLFSSWAWRRNSRRNFRLLAKVRKARSRVLVVAKEYFPHSVGSTSEYDVFILYTMKLSLADGVTPWLPPAHDREAFLALETEYYRGARRVFVGGAYVKPHLVEEYGVDPERVVVAGGGVHPFYLDHRPADIPDRFRGNIVFVGWDFGMKGGRDLLAAYEIVRQKRPDIALTIAGPDPGQQTPREGVVWKGRIQSKAELLQLYRSSDLFVMPSLRDSFGFVFLEAMTQGVPCIGTDLNAMPEIIADGESGYVVPPRNPSALAEAILRYYGEPENRRRMGEAAQQRVLERYTWAKVARTILTHDEGGP